MRTALQQNIDVYNQQLLNLFNHLNFTVLEFHVKYHYLSNDNIHIHLDHRAIVKNSIFNYLGVV